jgi:hypothetical protein
MEIKNFAGDVLRTVRGDSLSGADLSRADLSGAHLYGAHLYGANLSGARGIAGLGTPDGWHGHAWLRDGRLSIRIGCREKHLDEALAYWAPPEKMRRREVVAAVRYAEAIAIARGWPL